MKWLDPHLIKFGFIALALIIRVVSANARRQKTTAKKLRPPQSSPGPAPIAPPTEFKSPGAPMRNQSPSQPAQAQDPGSPWSTTKGPFDS